MQPNSKIVGSFLLGFALVATAYTFSNFGSTAIAPNAVLVDSATQQAAPIRSAIAVTDTDGNGIEDWRDEFVTTDPIILSEEGGEEYVPPTTFSGQMGLSFVQSVLESRVYGDFGRNEEEIIADTLRAAEVQTSHAIFDTPDISIIEEWEGETIRTYANTVALILATTGDEGLEHELLILQDIMNRNDESRLAELETIAEQYRYMRDEIVNTPVPAVFVKQHLDLINTLHAVHNDIHGMTLAFSDPAYALLRIKRYEDDVLGMQYALSNMYTGLEPYAGLFTVEDPAVFFVEFNPTNRIRI